MGARAVGRRCDALFPVRSVLAFKDMTRSSVLEFQAAHLPVQRRPRHVEKLGSLGDVASGSSKSAFQHGAFCGFDLVLVRRRAVDEIRGRRWSRKRMGVDAERQPRRPSRPDNKVVTIEREQRRARPFAARRQHNSCSWKSEAKILSLNRARRVRNRACYKVDEAWRVRKLSIAWCMPSGRYVQDGGELAILVEDRRVGAAEQGIVSKEVPFAVNRHCALFEKAGAYTVRPFDFLAPDAAITQLCIV